MPVYDPNYTYKIREQPVDKVYKICVLKFTWKTTKCQLTQAAFRLHRNCRTAVGMQDKSSLDAVGATAHRLHASCTPAVLPFGIWEAAAKALDSNFSKNTICHTCYRWLS